MGSSQSCCQCEEGSELYSSSSGDEKEGEHLEAEKLPKKEDAPPPKSAKGQGDPNGDLCGDPQGQEVTEEEIKAVQVGEVKNPLNRIDSLGGGPGDAPGDGPGGAESDKEPGSTTVPPGKVVKHVKQVVKYVVVDEDSEGTEISRSEEVVITKKEVLVEAKDPLSTRFMGTYISYNLLFMGHCQLMDAYGISFHLFHI